MTEPYEDQCYECGAYGDDYRLDENGEWVSACDDCPFSPWRTEDEVWND